MAGHWMETMAVAEALVDKQPEFSTPALPVARSSPEATDDITIVEIEERYRETRSINKVQDRIDCMLKSVQTRAKQICVLKFMVTRTEEFLNSVLRREEIAIKKLRHKVERLTKRLLELGEDDDEGQNNPLLRTMRVKVGEYERLVEDARVAKEQATVHSMQANSAHSYIKTVDTALGDVQHAYGTYLTERNLAISILSNHLATFAATTQKTKEFPSTDFIRKVVSDLGKFLQDFPSKLRFKLAIPRKKPNADHLDLEITPDNESFAELDAEYDVLSKELVASGEAMEGLSKLPSAKSEVVLSAHDYFFKQVEDHLRSVATSMGMAESDTMVASMRDLKDSLELIPEQGEDSPVAFMLQKGPGGWERLKVVLVMGKNAGVFDEATPFAKWLCTTVDTINFLKKCTPQEKVVYQSEARNETTDAGTDPIEPDPLDASSDFDSEIAEHNDSYVVQPRPLPLIDEGTQTGEDTDLALFDILPDDKVEDEVRDEVDVKITQLKEEKHEAVQREDYDRAKYLKWEITEMLDGKKDTFTKELEELYREHQVKHEGLVELLKPIYTTNGHELTVQFATDAITELGLRLIPGWDVPVDVECDMELPMGGATVSGKLIALEGWLKVREGFVRKRAGAGVGGWWVEAAESMAKSLQLMRIHAKRRAALSKRCENMLVDEIGKIKKVQEVTTHSLSQSVAEQNPYAIKRWSILRDLITYLARITSSLASLHHLLNMSSDVLLTSAATVVRSHGVIRASKRKQRVELKTAIAAYDMERSKLKAYVQQKYVPKKDVGVQTDKQPVVQIVQQYVEERREQVVKKPRWEEALRKQHPPAQGGKKARTHAKQPPVSPHPPPTPPSTSSKPAVFFPRDGTSCVTLPFPKPSPVLIPVTPGSPKPSRRPLPPPLPPSTTIYSTTPPIVKTRAELCEKQSGMAKRDVKDASTISLNSYCETCRPIVKKRETQRMREDGYSWLPDTNLFKYQEDDAIPCLVKGCASRLKWVRKLRLELYSLDGRLDTKTQQQLLTLLGNPSAEVSSEYREDMNAEPASAMEPLNLPSDSFRDDFLVTED
eukprot:TRINITY_DN12660_c1_g1_i1.p1 TRINITY_DN12660_c1_g1~~TRINITY_DN12660_c1_g1_i1.p1  ORF type:complete len:1172 (+),score=350.99 TRINITY_DN12660_c1_g1_i1:341-3517(+)